MTGADIERLAREAGYSVSKYGIFFPQYGAEDESELLARFAALVRADERERCAKTAESTPTCLLPSGAFLSERVAAAIRALKDKP